MRLLYAKFSALICTPIIYLNDRENITQMADYGSKIKDFEDELKKTKYNKRTQHHVGLVKAKIAQLKEKEKQRSSGKGPGDGYSVRRTGDATVIMIGFPSAGKSTLLNALTNAHSAVGAYEFTTLTVIPGMMTHKDAKIQVLDVPGIVHGAALGRGRGKEVLACIYNADLVLFIIDVQRPHALPVLQREVYDANIRINQIKPDIRIRKTARGGISIGKTVPVPELDNETIVGILHEFRINNAEVIIRTPINADQLIDVIEGNKRYVPGVVVMNKMDMIEPAKLEEMKREFNLDICISASQNLYLEELKDLMFSRLGFLRVYCKQVGKKADLEIPLILQSPATLRTMCEKLHKDFVSKFTYARIWGKSVKYEGQRILKLDHPLSDKDVIEIHLK